MESKSNTQYVFPEAGCSQEDLGAKLDELNAMMTDGERGKFASTAFWGSDVMQETVEAAYERFHSWNALFSFQEAGAARMENDVIDICIGLAGGDASSRGNLTSGGTESIFCALHAMRNWARENKPEIKRPQVVAPYSIHATFHKAARILDIEVVTVPQKEDLSADLEGIAEQINPNTIGLACSAPSWPFACVDPVEELGALAIQHDLWLHVDACVGAYILPFFRELGQDIPAYDFSVKGVRSISGDLHKYGYAPKPVSSVLWRSQDEQSYHFMPVTEWPCGLYLSQSLIGSRPLAPIASAWALFHRLGREGYLENARQLLKVKQAIIDKVSQIEGLHTWPSHGPLLQIAAQEMDIQLVVGGMEKRGWRLLGVNEPPAIHLTIDIMTASSLEKFLNDLAVVAEKVRSGSESDSGMLSYGGVGDEETAPKWLLSAVEILDKKSSHT